LLIFDLICIFIACFEFYFIIKDSPMSKANALHRPLRILQCGLGPLGIMLLRHLAARRGFELAGLVDNAPQLAGKFLADVAEIPGIKNLPIHASIQEAVRETNPDVCIIMTVSDLVRIEAQITEAISAGVHVVSTCEELSHPWVRDAAMAERLDQLARKHGRCILGTGVNPGFLMDFLPVTLTGLCHRVDSILVERYQNASARRLPFQEKIGAGLSLAEFEKKHQEGKLRHVGLEESLHFIASELGWKLDRAEDVLEPVLATNEIQTAHFKVPVGNAIGVRQTGSGFRDGRKVIELVFHAALELSDPRDRIVIEGEPRIDSTIAGGVQGDIATCSITLNACRRIGNASPGLQHMSSLPGFSWKDGPE
jgi:2,4-diaminopentanoate dehydrogenase